MSNGLAKQRCALPGSSAAPSRARPALARAGAAADLLEPAPLEALAAADLGMVRRWRFKVVRILRTTQPSHALSESLRAISTGTFVGCFVVRVYQRWYYAQYTPLPNSNSNNINFTPGNYATTSSLRNFSTRASHSIRTLAYPTDHNGPQRTQHDEGFR